ncbi:MAG: sn-glycerol-3-phosphate ABC transporter ATP-binding protein UgpC [Roseitalea porphyridii]
MSKLELENVRKSFGAVEVIKGANLSVESGEFVVFVGPSGCGKSTLLRMISGLEDITAGTLRIDGAVQNDVSAADRELAMVFQSYALYPHMTVDRNLSFGLRMTGAPRAVIDERVKRAMDILQIAHLADRRPKALSGGQRQRVAIGRAIVRQPKIFLFDEPLSNLDAELRVQMRVEIARLHKELGTTMIYVTHDQTEAMTMADRIVVLRDGLIEQVGSPLDLFDNPVNQFVASFLGSPRMNFLAARIEKTDRDRVQVSVDGQPETRLDLVVSRQVEPGQSVTFGIRPEHFVSEGAGDAQLDVAVDVVEHLGSTNYAYADAGAGQRVVVQRGESGRTLTSGDRIRLGILVANTFLFDADGARLT